MRKLLLITLILAISQFAYSQYDPTSGNLIWGASPSASWGNGFLSMNSGWNSGSYPTIGSTSGTSGSIVMLHNPHIPFRTDNSANGFTGKAGIRLAIDVSATRWWDIGLAGDFFHVYRNGSGELFRVTDLGRVGIGNSNPEGGVHFKSSVSQANTIDDGIAFQKTLGDDYSIQLTSAGGIPHLDFANQTNEDYDIRLGIYNEKELAILGGNVGIGINDPTEKLDVEGDIRWGSTSSSWGDGTLNMDDGWGGKVHPTIGSLGVNGSLIMLDNPHVPFRTDNSASGFTGRAGIRAAIDQSATRWWDIGLAGDFFHIYRNGSGEFFRISSSGSVGIGTSNPDPNFKLSVNGSIRGKEVKVEANWPDFVFYDNYELRTLEEVEEHINENGHLPEIPNEAEVSENGINLGEMNAKLLQKIEELTLYLIEQNKELKSANMKIEQLQKEVSALKN